MSFSCLDADKESETNGHSNGSAKEVNGKELTETETNGGEKKNGASKEEEDVTMEESATS